MKKLILCVGLIGVTCLGIDPGICLAQPLAYVTNNQSLTVSVIDTASNSVVATIPVGFGPDGIAVTPDGSRVYVTHAGGANFVSVIDAARNTVVDTITVEGQPLDIAITPNGAFAYVANSLSNSVSVIETATNTAVATINTKEFPQAVAIAPDGSRTYVAHTGGEIAVINTATNTVIATILLGPPSGPPGGLAVGPNGNRLYVADGGGGLTVIDTTSNTVVARVALNGTAQRVAVVPDGTKAYVPTFSTALSVVDTATNTLTTTVQGFISPQDIAITPDGTRAYMTQSGDANSVAVIDTATNAVVAIIPAGDLPARIAIAKGVPSSFSSSVFVPIVLTAAGLNNSFFTSEMTLTNKGDQNATVNFTYTSTFGSGSGTAADHLEAGKQRVIPDAISYLRSIGVPIPNSGSHGGTLRVSFSGLSSPSDVAVTVRTTTVEPEGRAGVAYSGATGLTSPSYLTGLRQNATDRSNVAIQNAGTPSDGDVTLSLTVFSGEPGTSFSQTLPDVVLAPGGFQQIFGILSSNGLSLPNGYVRVERTTGTAPYYAYAVINDQFTSDGSFIPPILEGSLVGRTKLTLPVLVEANTFSTELELTNWSSDTKMLQFSYVADVIKAPNSTANFTMEVNPHEQLILPDFVERLRESAVPGVGPKGPSYAGAVFAEVANGDLSGISVAARTSSPGGGGRYGLFYTSVPAGTASATSAWIYGLRQNAENRSNLTLVNTGEVDSSQDSFSIELYDGETGKLANTINRVNLAAGGWRQFNTILAEYASQVQQGYADVVRKSGNNPFIAYAVINDGAQPGQRSGDGAFISSAP